MKNLLADALVGKLIGLAGQSFQRSGVDLVALVGNRFGRPFGGADGLDGDGETLVIKAGTELHYRHRAHGVAGEFFFAAPDHLDRAAHGLGQLDRLREGHGRLVQEVPAEEAAQQGRMDGDLLRRQSGLLGDGGLEHFRCLVGEPHLQRAIGVEAGRGRRRFQLGMIEVLAAVAGLHHGLGTGQGLGLVGWFLLTLLLIWPYLSLVELLDSGGYPTPELLLMAYGIPMAVILLLPMLHDG